METRLDLSRYCIETAARKRYERLIHAYFKYQTTGIEQEISGLRFFLEQGDFSELRTRLQPFNPKEAVLIIPESFEHMRVWVMDEAIPMPWKNKSPGPHGP